MSFSGRSLNLAALGCLAAFLFLQSAPASRSAPQDHLASETNSSQELSNQSEENGDFKPDTSPAGARLGVPVVGSEQAKSKPEPFEPDCNRPKDAETGNFCQQKRAAKAGEDAARATEDATRVAWQQYYLSVFGLLGVVCTVGLTFWAAFAASRAAKEAARSANISAETLVEIRSNAERQLRAYVFAVGARIRRFAVDEPIEVALTLKNTGQTPAFGFHLSFAIALDDKQHFLPRSLDWGNRHMSILGPGEHCYSYATFGPNFKLSADNLAEIEAERCAIWAYGELRYKDAFNFHRSTKFRFIYEGTVTTDPPGGMAHAPDGNEAN